MKIASAVIGFALFAAGCATVPKQNAGDPYSGRAWESKFEACMCEVEAPLVFSDGVAYLYNRAHGSLRRIGAYEIRGASAVLHDYRGVQTQITCSLLPDGKMLMSVDPLVREMGWVGFRDRDLMPWSLPEVSGRNVLGRANKLIRKERKTKPNKAMEPTPVSVTIPAAQEVVPLTSVAHLGR